MSWRGFSSLLKSFFKNSYSQILFKTSQVEINKWSSYKEKEIKRFNIEVERLLNDPWIIGGKEFSPKYIEEIGGIEKLSSANTDDNLLKSLLGPRYYFLRDKNSIYNINSFFFYT